MEIDEQLLSFVNIPKAKGNVAMNILLSKIKQFQSLLSEGQNMELCANGMRFVITGLRSRGDYIIFEGLTENRTTCRLIINIHQLCFSLSAVPVGGLERHRIGFSLD